MMDLPKILTILIFPTLTTLLTMPLTSVFKIMFKNADDSARQAANIILNAIFAGIIGIASGAYGMGGQAIALGFFATLFGALQDKGFWELLKNLRQTSPASNTNADTQNQTPLGSPQQEQTTTEPSVNSISHTMFLSPMPQTEINMRSIFHSLIVFAVEKFGGDTVLGKFLIFALPQMLDIAEDGRLNTDERLTIQRKLAELEAQFNANK